MKNYPVILLLLLWSAVVIRAAVSAYSAPTELVLIKTQADLPTAQNAGPPNATVILWTGRIVYGDYVYLEYCTDATGAVKACAHPSIKGISPTAVSEAVLVDVGHSVTYANFAYCSALFRLWTGLPKS